MNLHLSTKELTLVGLCTALMAVFSQITIPLPFTPVPMTLQIFGIVLISVILEHKLSTLTLIVYILLGTIGIPVFSGFSGGFGVITGPSGGYIWGFVLLAFLVGFGSYKKNRVLLYALSFSGVMIDLILGAVQLKYVAAMSMNSAIAGGILPFIIKDTVTVFIAIFIGYQIKPRLSFILGGRNNAAY